MIMNVRDLVPWARSGERSLAADPQGGSTVWGLQREMNRVFDDFWKGSYAPEIFGARSWPSVDVEETDAEYRVTAELPGMKEEDVELTLRENVLTIAGERTNQREERSDNGRYYTERFHGRFSRAVPLAVEVDQDEVAATFNNGVLTVILPKQPQAAEQTRRIPIKKAH